MRHVVIVSPHRDDAAFSCAIAIRWLATKCRVTIANCFTVSHYAPYRTDEIGTVSEIRLREDIAFAKVCKASLNDLALVDAPERLGIGISGISTVRSLGEEDAVPRREIEHHIRSLQADLILAPITIGDHIDHRISRAASLGAIAEIGSAIGFYEDLPYAARNSEARLQELVREIGITLHPWTIPIDDGVVWKRSCALLYPSQISQDTAEEIALYGVRYENGERYWMTSEAVHFIRSLDQE